MICKNYEDEWGKCATNRVGKLNEKEKKMEKTNLDENYLKKPHSHHSSVLNNSS